MPTCHSIQLRLAPPIMSPHRPLDLIAQASVLRGFTAQVVALELVPSFGTGSKLWNATCQDQTSQMIAIPKASSSFRSRSVREPGAAAGRPTRVRSASKVRPTSGARRSRASMTAAPKPIWHRRPRRSRPRHRFLGRRHPLINVHSIGSRPKSLPRPRVGADCPSRGGVTASGDAARHPRRQGTARAD